MHVKSIKISDLNWNLVFKDTAKFFALLVLFYGIGALLMWGHGYLALENLNINEDELFENIMASSSYEPTEIKEFDLEFYKRLGPLMGHAMFMLTCFGVFFTRPPKKFKEVVLSAILISLIGFTIFLLDLYMQWLINNLFLFGSILMAWLCAVGWNKFKEKSCNE